MLAVEKYFVIINVLLHNTTPNIEFFYTIISSNLLISNSNAVSQDDKQNLYIQSSYLPLQAKRLFQTDRR